MINIGKYVNTHGIKGEIRLISDFSRKDLIFVPNFKIYIDGKEFIIEGYRKHKEYDMLKLLNIDNINDILHLKGKEVYIDENDIKDFIIENLTNYRVIINDKEYFIKEVINNKQKLLLLDNDKYIPYVSDFIIKKDDVNKVIYMNVPNGLI